MNIVIAGYIVLEMKQINFSQYGIWQVFTFACEGSGILCKGECYTGKFYFPAYFENVCMQIFFI